MEPHQEKNTPSAPDESKRTGRFRRAIWMLSTAMLGILGYVFFGPPATEVPLEAGSRAPITQPVPQTLPALEPPPTTLVPPEPPAPDSPSAWSAPDNPAPSTEAIPELDGPSYVGPSAPEFTGAPAPDEAGLTDRVLFGHPVLGLHPEFARRLQQAEAAATDAQLGVEMIVGYRAGSRAHSHGLAVDINYYANPYVMHERGEDLQDERLALVYHRIAQTMLRRDSVIPSEITEGAPDPTRTLRLYRALRDESRAMIAYFRLMQDREALARFRSSAGAGESPDVLQRQMAEDYVTLSGRPGPAVAGLEYPSPEPTEGDPPFAGDPTFRGPEFGFLNLPEELMHALIEAGLRWGGTDMGESSGDLMHFYLPASEVRSAASNQ